MGITAPTCRSACAAHLVARAAHTLTQRHTPAAPTLRVLVYSHQTIWVAPSGRAEKARLSPVLKPASPSPTAGGTSRTKLWSEAGRTPPRTPHPAAAAPRPGPAPTDGKYAVVARALSSPLSRPAPALHEHSGEGPAPASLEPADAVRVLPPAAEEGGAPDGRLHLEPRARRVVEEGEGAAVKVRLPRERHPSFSRPTRRAAAWGPSPPRRSARAPRRSGSA